VIVLSYRPGFELRDVWYVSVASATLQAVLAWYLMARTMKARLRPRPLKPT
jgi:p-aminobenzoyl-glutamate transporter AbgT